MLLQYLFILAPLTIRAFNYTIRFWHLLETTLAWKNLVFLSLYVNYLYLAFCFQNKSSCIKICSISIINFSSSFSKDLNLWLLRLLEFPVTELDTSIFSKNVIKLLIITVYKTRLGLFQDVR